MCANTSPSPKPRGIISLLALMIMAAITATAVGSAGIILTELRQTENLDQSLSAVYAAEAGLEDGLYSVKISRSSLTLDETLALLAIASNHYRIPLPTQARWDREYSIEKRFIIPRLPADKSANLDIFNPDSPGGGSGLQSIRINWSVDCSQIVQLEVTMLTWDEQFGVITFDPSTQRVFKYTQACNQNSSLQCDDIILNSISGVNIDPDQPYRFTFRELVPQNSSCTAENIVVTGYSGQNGQGNVIDIPTRIEVKATGTFARSKQALTASIPWKAPISGLLGFVIFSDTDITK